MRSRQPSSKARGVTPAEDELDKKTKPGMAGHEAWMRGHEVKKTGMAGHGRHG